MNPDDQPPTEAMLQAWVDDRLSDANSRAVEEHLAAHPEVASRLRRYREQNAALRAAMQARYPDVGGPKFPLAALVRSRSTAPSMGTFGRAAAMIAALVLGGLAGGGGVAFWMRSAAAPVAEARPTLARDAFVAHRTFTAEVRHFVEVAASEAHLLPWLSNRLGKPVTAPDLADMGYRLIGGRVLPTLDGQAAQLMYENAGGARLTLYLRAEALAEDAGLRFEERDGAAGVWWSERGFSYALFAALDQDRLRMLAERVQGQLRS